MDLSSIHAIRFQTNKSPLFPRRRHLARVDAPGQGASVLIARDALPRFYLRTAVPRLPPGPQPEPRAEPRAGPRALPWA